MKTSGAFAVASAIILAICAVPADAAMLNRTYVSNSGNDANPCTLTSPCASFQAALNTTAAGGEVDCLNTGDFGNYEGSGNIGIVISQSVSIICEGANHGTILTTGGNWGVTVGAFSNNSVVYLSGLDINGLNGAGAIGLNVTSASTVYIVNSSIRGFTTGVAGQSLTNPTRIFIKNSQIINNSNGLSLPGENVSNALIVDNSIVDGGSNYAARAAGPDSALALTRTLLTGSPIGLQATFNASATSIGPSNTITGTITGSITSVPFK
jgi:hypothetical protein